jgi:hypothetical protein
MIPLTPEKISNLTTKNILVMFISEEAWDWSGP